MVFSIANEGDVIRAKRESKDMAKEMGFTLKDSEDIALAVMELATNLVKYAGGGKLYLREKIEKDRKGFSIQSLDMGPGIHDPEEAISSGYSTGGSLGYGLSTVNMVMDEFDIKNNNGPDKGLHIACVKWLKEKKGIINIPIDIGAATRPKPGMTLNGDAVVIRKWRGNALLAVIDGLGHGQFAHRASVSIKDYIENHYEEPIEALFQRAGYVSSATRGAVMAIAKFDYKTMELFYGCIGNIEARVLGPSEPFNFIVRRGIIGKKAPDPVVTRHHWHDSYIMILTSDGINTHWEWDRFIHLMQEPAQTVAGEMLRELSRENDDATVAVIKGRKNVY